MTCPLMLSAAVVVVCSSEKFRGKIVEEFIVIDINVVVTSELQLV